MKKNNEDRSDKYKYIWLFVIGSLLLVVSLWILNYFYLKDGGDERGTFGDMFGAVNAAFSGLAFAGIIISLYMQRIDLKNQLEQLELNHQEVQQTNREFHLQNKTLQIQKFENQYYKMVDLHKENVNEIELPIYKKEEHIEPIKSGSNFIKGKSGFVDMQGELEVCLEVSINELEILGKYKKSDILHFAYSIFFWGIDSKFCDSATIDSEDQDKVKKRIKKLLVSYKRSSGIVKCKYVPFQGHESRLAHYYRHLFQTVKYVVKQEESGLISYLETRQYLRVLRAQLSNSEQLMLYYNYSCGFGQNWDKLGEKNYRFLSKYRMIHNIPIDKVEFVEPPREHFKKYIEQEATKDDPLFEWGDS